MEHVQPVGAKRGNKNITVTGGPISLDWRCTVLGLCALLQPPPAAVPGSKWRQAQDMGLEEAPVSQIERYAARHWMLQWQGKRCVLAVPRALLRPIFNFTQINLNSPVCVPDWRSFV